MDEVQLEHRLTQIENKVDRWGSETERMADNLAEQNGRVRKLELASVKEAAFVAGRASVRKTDLAVIGALFAAISFVAQNFDAVRRFFG